MKNMITLIIPALILAVNLAYGAETPPNFGFLTSQRGFAYGGFKAPRENDQLRLQGTELLENYDAGTKFSINLLKEAALLNKNNVVMSPFSAYVAMLMTSYGAAGNTERQMVDVLQRPGNGRIVDEKFPRLFGELESLPASEIRMANGIFVSNVSVLEDFEKSSRQRFRANVTSINLGNKAQSVKAINDWVARNTNDKIKNIVKESNIKTDKGLHLISAMYFKGEWLKQFNKAETKNEPFYVNGQTPKNVPTMYLKDFFKIGELEEVDAIYVVLPYRDENLSMMIVIPKQKSGLWKIESQLEKISPTKLTREARNEDTWSEIELHLPKFKIESAIDLSIPLWRMGMKDMFLRTADFSKIGKPKLKIGGVVQKAVIEVNEEGSVAAAATDVDVVELLMLSSYQKIFVDRPSMFFINYGDVTLFSGRLAVPVY